MEKTVEQIENILERATLDQLKLILKFLRTIINKCRNGTPFRQEPMDCNARTGRTLRRLPRLWT